METVPGSMPMTRGTAQPTTAGVVSVESITECRGSDARGLRLMTRIGDRRGFDERPAGAAGGGGGGPHGQIWQGTPVRAWWAPSCLAKCGQRARPRPLPPLPHAALEPATSADRGREPSPHTASLGVLRRTRRSQITLAVACGCGLPRVIGIDSLVRPRWDSCVLVSRAAERTVGPESTASARVRLRRSSPRRGRGRFGRRVWRCSACAPSS